MFGVNDDYLQAYDSMTFTLSIQNTNGTRLECPTSSNCRIKYDKSITPRLHYLSPPVVYFESYTQLWFDPRAAADLAIDLKEEEKAFISARIGPAVMDFENTITHEDIFNGYLGFASESVIG